MALVLVDIRSQDYEHWSFNIPLVLDAIKSYHSGSQVYLCLPEPQIAILHSLRMPLNSVVIQNSITQFLHFILRQKREDLELVFLNINPVHLLMLFSLIPRSKGIKIYLHNEVFLNGFSLKGFLKALAWRLVLRLKYPSSVRFVASSRQFKRYLFKKGVRNPAIVVEPYRLLDRASWEMLASDQTSRLDNFDFLFLGSTNHSRGLDLLIDFATRNPDKRIAICGFRIVSEVAALPNIVCYSAATPAQYASLLTKCSQVIVSFSGLSYRLGTSGIISDVCGAKRPVLINGRLPRALLNRMLESNIPIRTYELNRRILLIRDGKIGDHILAIRTLISGFPEFGYYSFKRSSIRFGREVLKLCFPGKSYETGLVFSIIFFRNILKFRPDIYWISHPKPNQLYLWLLMTVARLIDINLFRPVVCGNQYLSVLRKSDCTVIRGVESVKLENVSFVHRHFEFEPEMKYTVLACDSSEDAKDLSNRSITQIISNDAVQRSLSLINKVLILVGKSRSNFNETLPKGVYDLRGQTNLSELFHIIQMSEHVIGVDSAPIHIATLLGKKTTVLQNNRLFEPYWHPPVNLARNIVVRGLGCSGCNEASCPYGDNFCVNHLSGDLESVV